MNEGIVPDWIMELFKGAVWLVLGVFALWMAISALRWFWSHPMWT